MLKNKSYATVSPKSSLVDNTIKTQKIDFFSFFLSTSEASIWFILFGLIMRKLWTILFFGQSKHLIEKTTYIIYFWVHFSQFSQKNCLIGLSLFAIKIPPLEWWSFNSILELLKIYYFIQSWTYFYLTIF